MNIDTDRLRADLEALARFGADDDGGVSRPSFSPADLQARAWLQERCERAGLHYREDVVGNVFMRLDGPDVAPVWTGSHLDSVPNGGRLDGALGVVAALEVVRSLREQQVTLARPVEAVSFVDEEGGFLGFLGSRAVASGLRPGDLRALVGRDGRRLVDAMEQVGFAPEQVEEARIDPSSVHAFVEMHIEQGVVLEDAGFDVGVVSSIVGVGRCSVEFRGRPDHAGTTPMHLRRDAMRGAADLLAQVPGLPGVVGAPDAVITCGRIDLHPDAYNIVPGWVRLGFDIRHPDRTIIEALEREVAERAADAAELHHLEVKHVPESLTDPTPLDDRIRQLTRDAADEVRATWLDMPSGAGHDSQVIAPLVPTGMVFVPSVDGRSHSPLERTSWEDIAAGTSVLYGVVRRLATDGRT